MLNPRYYSSLKEIITPTHLNYEIIKSVTSKFPFRANKYYLSLVNWDDPNDPISRIIVPDITELNAWGDIDASREKDFTVLPGLQHKYEDTALILISDECAGYCRFCFRKRIFKEGNSEVESDFTDARDIYGKSKALGEVDYPHTITLRTSTIGHELNSAYGLLDWFLSQNKFCKGYSSAIFSGVPTVILAQIIRDIVIPHKELSGIYHVAAKSINKHELLKLIAEVYGKCIQIIPDDSLVIDRSLNADKFRAATGYVAPEWLELIRVMHTYK